MEGRLSKRKDPLSRASAAAVFMTLRIPAPVTKKRGGLLQYWVRKSMRFLCCDEDSAVGWLCGCGLGGDGAPVCHARLSLNSALGGRVTSIRRGGAEPEARGKVTKIQP